MRRIAASVVVLGCLGLYALPSATAGASPSSPGRYIVVLRDSVADPGAVSAAHGRAHQAQVSHVYRKALKGYAATIPADRVDDIRADSRVAYVEVDGTVSAVGKPGGGGGTTPPPAQTIPAGITTVGATVSSTLAGNGTGAVNGHVWVIDTGVDAAHPDLNVVEFKNFAGGPNKDCNGHGTHVAGTVAAEDDASHVVGVAPGASIHAIKVLGCSGSGSNSGVIAGIDWVTEHALPGAVANMSLGGGASQAIDEAVRASADAGVLYVLAAGNANVDACTTSPARAGAGTNNGIVTVGALSAPGTRASFSNFGSCVDIWAPGVNVLSTWPGATTRALSGTSMAAPHVAGGGALLRSVSIGSGLSVSEAEEQLKDDAVAGTFPLLDVSGY